MGRWATYDTDEERLPDGIERIGYDADTQVYTFRDERGMIYESAPGNRYGMLHSVGGRARSSSDDSLPPQVEASKPVMTEFPDTWDPPKDSNGDAPPLSQRIIAPFRSLHRSFTAAVTSVTSQPKPEDWSSDEDSQLGPNDKKRSRSVSQPSQQALSVMRRLTQRDSARAKRFQTPRDLIQNGADLEKKLSVWLEEKDPHEKHGREVLEKDGKEIVEKDTKEKSKTSERKERIKRRATVAV